MQLNLYLMKTITLLAAVVLISTMPGTVNATGELYPPTIQVNTSTADPFSSFRIHRQGHGVMVLFSAAPGHSAVEFVVEKTYNDLSDPYAYWEQVTTVPGSQIRTNKVLDNAVLPGFIHFRVGAVQQDGSIIYSAVESVRIVSH